MGKYIALGVLALIVLILVIIPRVLTFKYTGSTIRVFNKTLKGVCVAYVGKIVSEREQKNVIPYPYVNLVFLCRPSKNVKEKYYTYDAVRKKLYCLDDPSPKNEKTNTEENSKFHEILITPLDSLFLKLVFRQYG